MSYREFQQTKGSRKRDSTVYCDKKNNGLKDFEQLNAPATGGRGTQQNFIRGGSAPCTILIHF